jgi:hypothetical protein
MQIFILATIAFLVASRYLNRYPEDREIARGMKRVVPVSATSGNNAAFIFPQGHVSCLPLQTTDQGDFQANFEAMFE